ncbi:DUF6510 family protein [Streptomyces sp. TS71-3]|uniref:DUF6510 family protein n=1 Tax=Streptomyces sp. TS71-3 TaxID=2733862 RepID=UPI001B2BC8E5|nr:DUF6510 family protein [Streptomyces sp. TS71-3]GHJ37458.1 hypothetical protein Sm713_30670 [Streptomyces sp. TS71-3]
MQPDTPHAAPGTRTGGSTEAGTGPRTGTARSAGADTGTGTGAGADTGKGADGSTATASDPYRAQYEDGNALAGPLSELLAVDPTSALGRCTGCGAGWPLARLRVYSHAPGHVARCPDCDRVILRLVATPDRLVLDLRGTVALSFPREP